MKNRSPHQNSRNFFFSFNTTRCKLCSALLIALFFTVSRAQAQAPNISYPTPQTYPAAIPINPLPPANTGGAVLPKIALLGSLLESPLSVAVDAAGNTYFSQETTNDVKKIPAGGGAPVIIGSGFKQPRGVAVDASGNVYVADSKSGEVEEIPVGGGAMIVLGSGFSGPFGLAIDASNNLYVSDIGHNNVKKIPAGNGTPVLVASGFNYPMAVAVDAAGNVYVADQGNNAIKKVAAGTGTVTTLATASGYPDGVAVDAAGNVYYSDFENSSIIELPAGGGSAIQIGSAYYEGPDGVAVNAAGTIYVSDGYTNTVSAVYQTGGYSISPALPPGLAIDVNSGAISGTPTTVGAAQSYTVSAINNSGTGTTTVSIAITALPKPIISYSTPQTYTVNSQINPLSPVNTGGSAAPETPVTLTNKISNFVTAIAADGSGNVFVGGENAGYLQEIPAGGGNPLTIPGNYFDVQNIAVDAADNIYISGYGISKIPAGGGSIVPVAGGTNSATFLALDATGNLYFAELFSNSDNDVKKIPAGSNTPVVLASGFGYITGVAVDGFGNVYVADESNHVIKKIQAGNNAVVTLASGILDLNGVAADAAGNVFYTADNISTVTEIPANGGANIAVGSAFSSPRCIAIDPKGDIFVADAVPHQEAVKEILKCGYKISPALPIGLNFDAATGTISGIPQVVSPATNYTVTAANVAGSNTTTVNIAVNTSNSLGFSYNSPQVYYPTFRITPLPPLNTGGAIPGTATTTLGALALSINAIAVDASGGIYVTGASSTNVIKLSGGTFTALGSTLLNPTGVAVDAAGNVFIADNGHNSIKEIPAGSKTKVIFVAQVKDSKGNILTPVGIAVDAAGNLYVATTVGVYKIPAGSNKSTFIGGTNNTGVAVDAAGNVFSCDINLGEITEVFGGAGSPVVLASGLSSLGEITVDANDNVFYAQGNTVIMELPAGGGPAFAVATGLSNATTVALDGKGNIFTASNGGAIREAAFGVYNIAPTLPPGLSFDRKTGIISGTPQAITPAANYTVSASNAQGSSSTIVNIAISLPPKPNISYNTPQTYNVGTPVSITPVNTGGPVPAQVPVTLVSGLSGQAIRGLTLDASGNIYVTCANSGAVNKYPPGGGAPTYLGSGLSQPGHLALDASGNLFIADYGHGAIKEVLASNGSIVTYASGFNQPAGVAVDASGNVYVSEFAKDAIFKIPPGGGTPVELTAGLNNPEGIAVDQAGNIYIANYSGGNIKELMAGASTAVIFSTGFNHPYDVAVDTAGNVFVAEEGNADIKRIPAGGGTAAVIAKAVTLKEPDAIALDASGNIYIGDLAAGNIYEINPGYFVNPTLPAGLSIDQNTGLISGTPTVKSPKTNYTVSTRNTSGVSVATIEITVNPVQKPTVAYTSPQVYAVNTAIAPLAPKGSLASPASFTRSLTSFASALTGNEGVAVDPTGNVYAAETTNNQVVQIAPVGAITVLGSGFLGPAAVALDASKNVYVADCGNHAVKEITTGGTVLTLGSGFVNPVGVAVDKSGNVYVADNGFGIKKIPAGNGAPVTLTSPAYNNATAVAVDGYGNVFFTMGGVYEMLAGTNTIKQFNNSNAASANSVVVDGNGDIFYSAQLTSNSNRAIYQIPPGDSVSTQLNLGSTANTDNIYLAINSGGVLYLSDPTAGTVIKGTPVGGYFINRVLPKGLGINIGTGVISGTPAAASPATNYIVTGYNAKSSGAGTVTIKTVAGTNTSLTNLAVSSGTLSPSFATATTSYSVSEPYATSSITVTPTTGDGTAAITVNGVAVASKAASAAIPLAVGANTIQVTVTDNGGTTVSNYTITVNRTGNASLANFTINAGTLSPAFAPGTYSYSATMPAGMAAISVTPTLADTTGTITVNGKAIATGTASPKIQLAVGANTITTVTTASDGVTTQTYTLTATRLSPNANLASLQLSAGAPSPAFNSSVLSYTAIVANAVTSLTVTPTTFDAGATVTVNGTPVTSGSPSGAIALSAGANTVTLVVTAPDGGTTKTYTLVVNRTGSANDNLSSLALSQGALSPAFASGTLSYSVSVANTISSLTVTPTTGDPTASVTVNGTAVTSGSASAPINLVVGANTISVKVIAQDGSTTKTYTITVTRPASTNDNLSSMAISSGSLTPVFAAATTAYSATEPNNISSITATVTTADPAATVTVNGISVSSGSPSPAIGLSLGANTINVVVTAPDGTSAKTYTLTVTRQNATSAYLSALTLSSGTLNPVFASATTSYSASVANSVSSTTVTPTALDPSAQIKVNGTVVTSGAASGAITLAVGSNTISIVITPSQGIGTITYTLTVTRASGSGDSYDPGISVSKPQETPVLADDGIVVRQGLSPNGDGINDFLQIDNISRYPTNKLMIMNRNGQMIYEVSGYDNASKVFDGHSNKNGQMQLPGTYFYQLDYTAGGIVKHKTGFIVLKY